MALYISGVSGLTDNFLYDSKLIHLLVESESFINNNVSYVSPTESSDELLDDNNSPSKKFLKKIGYSYDSVSIDDLIDELVNQVEDDDTIDELSPLLLFDKWHLVTILYLFHEGRLTIVDIKEIISATSIKGRTELLVSKLIEKTESIDIFRNLTLLTKKKSNYSNKYSVSSNSQDYIYNVLKKTSITSESINSLPKSITIPDLTIKIDRALNPDFYDEHPDLTDYLFADVNTLLYPNITNINGINTLNAFDMAFPPEIFLSNTFFDNIYNYPHAKVSSDISNYTIYNTFTDRLNAYENDIITSDGYNSLQSDSYNAYHAIQSNYRIMYNLSWTPNIQARITTLVLIKRALNYVFSLHSIKTYQTDWEYRKNMIQNLKLGIPADTFNTFDFNDLNDQSEIMNYMYETHAERFSDSISNYYWSLLNWSFWAITLKNDMYLENGTKTHNLNNILLNEFEFTVLNDVKNRFECRATTKEYSETRVRLKDINTAGPYQLPEELNSIKNVILNSKLLYRFNDVPTENTTLFAISYINNVEKNEFKDIMRINCLIDLNKTTNKFEILNFGKMSMTQRMEKAALELSTIVKALFRIDKITLNSLLDEFLNNSSFNAENLWKYTEAYFDNKIYSDRENKKYNENYAFSDIFSWLLMKQIFKEYIYFIFDDTTENNSFEMIFDAGNEGSPLMELYALYKEIFYLQQFFIISSRKRSSTITQVMATFDSFHDLNDNIDRIITSLEKNKDFENTMLASFIPYFIPQLSTLMSGMTIDTIIEELNKLKVVYNG